VVYAHVYKLVNLKGFDTDCHITGMSSTNNHRERLRGVRKQEAEEGEPLIVKNVSVLGMSQDGATPYISPTSVGAEVAGLEIGGDAEVSIFEDGVFIQPADD
jgi:hypothetical protein